MVIFFTKENTVRIKASRNFFPANFPNKKKPLSPYEYINQKEKRSGAKQTELFRMFFTLHKQ